MQKEFITSSTEETENLARSFAQLMNRPGILFLKGEMGTGKTHFAKAFAEGYGSQDDTNSPTFTIINTYDSPNGKLHHLDLYRLVDPDEFYAAGLDESVLNNETALIEWPEIIEEEIRADAIIHIIAIDENKRRILLDVSDGLADLEELEKTDGR